MPPWRAMAMAMRDSVTVSMAAESSGTLTEIRLVSRDVVDASLGMTSVCPGRSMTSSYVSPMNPNGSGWSMGPLRGRGERVSVPGTHRWALDGTW